MYIECWLIWFQMGLCFTKFQCILTILLFVRPCMMSSRCLRIWKSGGILVVQWMNTTPLISVLWNSAFFSIFLWGSCRFLPICHCIKELSCHHLETTSIPPGALPQDMQHSHPGVLMWWLLLDVLNSPRQEEIKHQQCQTLLLLLNLEILACPCESRKGNCHHTCIWHVSWMHWGKASCRMEDWEAPDLLWVQENPQYSDVEAFTTKAAVPWWSIHMIHHKINTINKKGKGGWWWDDYGHPTSSWKWSGRSFLCGDIYPQWISQGIIPWGPLP